MEIVRPYPGLERGVKQGPGGAGQDGTRSQNMPSGWVSGDWSLASGLERAVKWALEVGAGHSEVSENAPGVGFGDPSLAWSTAERALPPALGETVEGSGSLSRASDQQHQLLGNVLEMQVPRVHADRLDEKAGAGLAGLVSSRQVWGWVPTCSPVENPCPKMAFSRTVRVSPAICVCLWCVWGGARG